MKETSDLFPLETRNGLPDALRVLADELPRSAWVEHPQFRGLAEFWLQKHLSFRRLSDLLGDDLRAALDGTIAPDRLRGGVSRYGGMLVGGLHDHHNVEDHHYFPQLLSLDPRMAHGFELLDRDHHALDPWLARLTDDANAVIRTGDRDATGRLLASLDAFAPFLARHLEDEEDLIVPVILRTGLG